MRLVLPTGDDGATRDYPLDNILNLSQVTLNETIEIRRVTGMDLSTIYRGFGMLDDLSAVTPTELVLAMSVHLELMESYRAMVWLARHRAGDRAPGGGVLTVEQAVDFPFVGLNLAPDPGDLAVKDESDPTVPPTDSGPDGGAAEPSKPTARGRSSKTSAKKS